MRLFGAVDTEHELGDVEVSAVRHVVGRRIVVVVAAIAVRAEAVEMLDA